MATYNQQALLQSKSIANSIYFSNWTLTTSRERRSLILIMINSQKGLMFSNNRMFALSLDTFTWVSKLRNKYMHAYCTQSLHSEFTFN